jgi:EmrB/QacA subfamily drug resistance transporter
MTDATMPASTETRSRNRWLALSVLALAQFLVVLDASIINIALPEMGRALALDPSLLSWVITAYVLPFGGLLLLGGRLADRYGHRNVFLLGVAGFITASLIAGFSVNGAMLLAARAVQGASAALLAPGALSLLMQIFPGHDGRDKALGLWGAVAGLGSVAGVLLGGVLTASFDWASIFFINVPVGLLVLGAIPLLVSPDRIGTERAALDLPGALTVTGGLVALVAGLSMVLGVGLLAPLTLGLFGLALVLLVAFVVIELRSAAPLLDFRIFGQGGVSAGNLAALLIGGAVTGLFFILSLFMQDVLGYDALTAGLTQVPLALALVVAAGLAPQLIGRFGSRPSLAVALLGLAVGLVWLSLAPVGADYVLNLLGPTLIVGVTLGVAFVACTELAVSGVGEADAGLASGLVNTGQQVGGAIGLATIFTVATARSADLTAHGATELAAMGGGHAWGFVTAAAFSVLAAVVVMLLKPTR